jgi:hypothetical protein
MAITQIKSRQLTDALDFTTKTLSVATPTQNAHAATKLYIDTALSSLTNAFNYIGTVAGGIDIANAYDLSQLTQKDAGDYYKVTTSGYFKIGAGAEFYAKLNDGLIWNLSSGIDIIDNTNSTVAGTADYISVSGSTDNGFTVDIASTFKTRMTTAESNITNFISNHYKNETPTGTVNGVNTDFVLSATPATGTLQVFVNGVMQTVTDDYSLATAAITFVSGAIPQTGDKVRAIYFV